MADYGEGLNRATIGKSYQGASQEVDVPTIAAFARATSDENPRYLDAARPGGIVAPPMFAVRPMKEILFAPLLDPEVNADLLMLLHGEQEMRFLAPIRPGDRVDPRSVITDMIDKESGQIIVLRMTCAVRGAIVCEAIASCFIRPRAKAEGAKKKEKPAPAAPAAPLVYVLEDTIQVAPDQSRRYALASLDDNPIHVDDATARAAGLPGVVLQGLCTMAFCQRALVNGVAGGDPARLRQLKVRFSKPVFGGDQLTVQGRVAEDRAGVALLDLRVVNQRGQEVISAGVAEVVRG
jgi:acyl dehydratase